MSYYIMAYLAIGTFIWLKIFNISAIIFSKLTKLITYLSNKEPLLVLDPVTA